tara:strand:- start:6522 stop:6875 length:354 start_codon:yes stop_codon:yes gene_type:complete
MAKITDINDKNGEWVEIGQKLLTPEMKAELLEKIEKREDIINQPKHYQGKTLELTDVYQDFFKADTVMDKYIMDIIKYAIRYRSKGLILENLGKIKKCAEMCIEIEKNKTKGLNDKT